MSYEEYSKIEHDTPYFYTYKTKNQLLYYFGCNHSHDPNHPQFSLLKEKWNEFIDDTKKIKNIVMVESCGISNDKLTLEKSIMKYGEVGAGIFLANESDSLIVFGEPKNDEIIKHLLKTFSKEEILLFFESIALKFWHKGKTNKSMEEFLSNHTNKYSELLNWPELIISVESISAIYKKIFAKELDINNKEIFSQITDPTTTESIINKLSRSQSEYRNEHILNQIQKYWDDKYNIFVIYGAGHAVMQERAIKSMD